MITCVDAFSPVSSEPISPILDSKSKSLFENCNKFSGSNDKIEAPFLVSLVDFGVVLSILSISGYSPFSSTKVPGNAIEVPIFNALGVIISTSELHPVKKSATLLNFSSSMFPKSMLVNLLSASTNLFI